MKLTFGADVKTSVILSYTVIASTKLSIVDLNLTRYDTAA